MKKIVVSCLLVILSVVVMSGCGNKAGEEAYAEFKERYAIDYPKSGKLDKVPLLIYEVQGTYYIKKMEKDKYTRYHKWNKGSEFKEGKEALIYESEGDWTALVGNSKPIYEQNMK